MGLLHGVSQAMCSVDQSEDIRNADHAGVPRMALMHVCCTSKVPSQI
jgi:hypothetical protein